MEKLTKKLFINRSGIEALCSMNTATTMLISMVFYRKDIRVLFSTISSEWHIIWMSQLPDSLRKSFLLRFKLCRIYTVTHFIIQTFIILSYMIIPLLSFHSEKLLSPFYIPGTSPNGFVSYFYQIFIATYTIYYSYILNTVFVVSVIYVSNQIDHQIYLIQCLDDKLVLRTFLDNHLKLLRFARKLSKILNFVGIVLTLNVSLYLCVEVFFITKVFLKIVKKNIKLYRIYFRQIRIV